MESGECLGGVRGVFGVESSELSGWSQESVRGGVR